jgi:stage V sporulation protein G
MTEKNAKVLIDQIMDNMMTDDNMCIIRDALTAYFANGNTPPKPKVAVDFDVQVQRMYRFETDRPLQAFADIIVNDAFLIKGIKVLDGKNGLFVSMPQEQAKDKKWYDSVRCLTQEVREQITEVCLSVYNEA